MRTHALLSTLALLAVALSGCSDDEPGLKEWEDEQEQTDALDTGSGNETADGDGADDNTTAVANAAPTASLVASASNGTAPLNVTFTLDGDDADGDELTWTFTVGNTTENGTSLPATVDATLDAGNWTATLTVSDGRNETVESVVVSVGGDSAAEVPAAGQSFQGSWATGTYGCGVSYDSHTPGLPADGVLYAELAIETASIGRTFVAEFGPLQLDELGGGVQFFDADGASVGGFINTDDPVVVTETVPAGAAWAVFSNCGAAGSDVTFTVS